MKKSAKIALAQRALDRHEKAFGRKIPDRIRKYWSTGEALEYEGLCLTNTEVPSFGESSMQVRAAIPSWEVMGTSGGSDIGVVGPGGDWKGAANCIPLFHTEQSRFFVARIDDPKCPVGYYEDETFDDSSGGYQEGVYLIAKSLDAFVKSLKKVNEPDCETDKEEVEDVWEGAAADMDINQEAENEATDEPKAAQIFRKMLQPRDK